VFVFQNPVPVIALEPPYIRKFRKYSAFIRLPCMEREDKKNRREV
jgi:hypothetical protein